MDGAALARLRQFLPGGRVDAKRRDGLVLLDAVRELLGTSLAPLAVSYHFADTDAWRSIRRRAMDGRQSQTGTH